MLNDAKISFRVEVTNSFRVMAESGNAARG
jgi:hypothetical protein